MKTRSIAALGIAVLGLAILSPGMSKHEVKSRKIKGLVVVGRGKSNGKVVTITIDNLKFQKSKVVVAPGTTVVWKNADQVAHDVTSGTALQGREARGKKKIKFPNGLFQSGLFSKSLKNNKYKVRFNEPGTYHYFCNLHPFMTGVVVVKKNKAKKKH